MIQSQTFALSASLRPFIRRIVLAHTHVDEGIFIRPVGARTDVVLCFALQRELITAFEYQTSAPRLLPRTLVIGPQTARQADLWLKDGWRSLAIHFQPAGFVRLFHMPVAPLTDRALDATDVLGDGIRSLHAELSQATSPAAMLCSIERFLSSRVGSADPEHAAARAAAAMLETHGRLRVADAIRHSGLSERHFERRFIEQMGMSPKLYARVARLNFVLQRKAEEPSTTWAAISQEAGYFDQTHLSKDFKAMLGVAPGAYLRRSQSRGGFLLSSRSRAV
jgi:AraC-like DNA-binding protein